MLALAPDALLAVEPGGTQLEAARHAEFLTDRVPNGTKEWFFPTPAVLAHIAERAMAHPVPDLAELTQPASQRVSHCDHGHALAGANAAASRAGGQICRACHMARARLTHAQRRGESLDVRAEADLIYAALMSGACLTCMGTGFA